MSDELNPIARKIAWGVLSFLAGAALVCGMATVQMAVVLGVALSLRVYTIPFLVGGISGLAIGSLFFALKQRIRKLEIESVRSGRIEEALQQAHDELEERVEQRTAILRATNWEFRREIGDRITAEEAARQSEEKIMGIVDAVADQMSMMDDEHNIVWANKVTQDTFGTDLVGSKCYQSYCGHETPCEQCPVKKSFADGKVHEAEIEMIGPGGKRPVFLCTASVVSRQNGWRPKTVVVTVRDVTEWKQSQETLRRAERLSSLGTLAAGIAHEINNPVGAALLAAETALAIKDDPDYADRFEKCLNSVVTSLDRCGQVVRNMLTFSRDEPTEKQPCQISEVIRQSRDLVRTYAQRHHTTIRSALDRDLPEVVIGRLDMELVLINLLRNAIKASGKEGQIVIRAALVAAGVQISIGDNGCGVTDEQKEHLFDPFYTTWQTKGGTGLGLSITYGIVQDHGGTIEVDSTPGAGTTVIVTLPVSEQPCGMEATMRIEPWAEY